MLLAPIPFDYATLLDPGDRVRRTGKSSTDRRVRLSAKSLKKQD
jgi:hypothetical protein